MTRHIQVISLIVGALTAAACADDPQPVTATITYEVCVGLAGRCGGDDCCATAMDRHAEGLTSVECEVRPGDTNDLYRIDFEIEGRADDGTNFGLIGDDVQLYSSANERRPVVDCRELIIDEARNDYPTTACDTLEVRADPPGGGCELRMMVDSNNVVQGQFRCKELALPGETLYLSTIYNSDVGWGEFQIEHCDFRL